MVDFIADPISSLPAIVPVVTVYDTPITWRVRVRVSPKIIVNVTVADMKLEIYRGNDIEFDASFLNHAGFTVQPTSANVKVAHMENGALIISTVAMEQQPYGNWLGVWPSGAADPGFVEWALLAEGDINSAVEGSFILKANRANQ